MKTKPLSSPCVPNRLHHHSNGLVFSSIFNEGIGKYITDYTYTNTTLSSNNLDWNENVICEDNSGYVTLPITPTNLTICSVVAYIKSYNSFTDGQTHTIFSSGKLSDNGAVLLNKSSNKLYLNLNSGGAHNIFLSPDKVPNWQTGTQIAFMWDSANEIKFGFNLSIAIDGVIITPDGDSSATGHSSVSNINPSLLFNYTTALDRPVGGECEYFYVYNKILSEFELKSICENPYAMFNNTDEE